VKMLGIVQALKTSWDVHVLTVDLDYLLLVRESCWAIKAWKLPKKG